MIPNVIHRAPGIPTLNETPPRARPTTWMERQESSLTLIPDAFATGYCALAHGHGKDYDLARLVDATRTLGVAGIDRLCSLGVNQTGGSIPLWLGGASWLGAMKVTPAIINSLVRWKTGFNLNTKYMSSNGEVRRLSEDPNYLVLQVLPLEQRHALATRYGIPLEHPDRQNLVQAKVKQIIVQAHTWWMLMAGIATPVLSSVICDRLEGPAKTLIAKARQSWVERFQLQPALHRRDARAIEKAMDNLVQATLGSGTEITPMSRWWSKLPVKVIKSLNLQRMTQAEILQPLEEKRFNRLVAHLDQELRKATTRSSLRQTLHVERTGLNNILAPLENLLQRKDIAGHLSASVKDKLQQQLDLARATAETTMHYLEKLANRSINQIPVSHARTTLKQEMEKPVLAYMEQVVRLGHPSQGLRLMGSKDRFRTAMKLFKQERYSPALTAMGDSPKSFLMRAVKSMALRRRWLLRFPILLGSGMLLSTLAYIGLFVGNNSGHTSTNNGGRS